MRLGEARADLEKRKAIASNEQVVRGVLVQQVFEVLRERVGPEAARDCRPALHGKSDFSPVAAPEFLDLLSDALALLEPAGLSAEDFYEALGRRAVLAVKGATIGRTLASMAAGDPQRLFAALGSGPSILIAFGDRRVVEVVPGRARIAFSGSLLPPGIMAGMYSAMAEGAGASTASTESFEPTLGDSEHVVTWR